MDEFWDVNTQINLFLVELKTALVNEDEEECRKLISLMSSYLAHVRNELNIPMPLLPLDRRQGA